jgi:DNA-binding beta-propeller fold protein YncE
MKYFQVVVVLIVYVIFRSNLVAQNQQNPNLLWPVSSDTPRIKYVSSISSLREIEKKSTSIFENVLHIFFGSEEQEHQFVQPVGIAVSDTKKIYVTDPGAQGIHILDIANDDYHFISHTLSGNLLSPVGIALSNEGMVYVSDSEQGKIIVYDEDNDVQFEITEHLQRPTGLLFAQQKLYVADAGKHALVIFNADGNFLTEYGHRGAGEGEFNFPIQIAEHDNLFVLDALNYRIQELQYNGKYSSAFGMQGNVTGKFASPKGIAIDTNGNYYVTDALMDNFQIFNKEKKLLLVVGTHGTREGEFMSPGGIAIDNSHQIYIVDMLNKRIQIFQIMNYQ